MTQEEKLLLLEDLSARLLYNVKFSFNLLDEEKQEVVNTVCTLFSLNTDGYCEALEVSGHIPLEFAKPYLRPMNSMTEDEYNDMYNELYLSQKEFYTNCGNTDYIGKYIRLIANDTVNDWLNKNMFDYRGLIKRGLALEAPEGMYNN